ncbi:MAG: FG-GAP repeat protein, partial [Candidatus Omnitrophica bacterium]|nr:FG-GAP repeat protein [Candidatus Omnitrophota bacterium]
MNKLITIKRLLVCAILLAALGVHSFAYLTVDMRDHGRFLRIVGQNSGDRTGTYVGLINMVGDPTPDLIVSSEFAEDYNDDHNVGRIDIFDGATLPEVGYIELENPIPRPALTIFGERDDGAFGRKVAVGDYDGDSVLDLAVAAPLYDSNGENQSGRVYLFFGGVVVPTAGGTLFQLNSDHLNADQAHVII